MAPLSMTELHDLFMAHESAVAGSPEESYSFRPLNGAPLC